MRKYHRTAVTTLADGVASFLLADMYALTMAYAWWKAGMANRRAVFYASFRRLPKNAGYAVGGGIDEFSKFLEHARFTEDDLDTLRELKDSDGDPLFAEAFIQFIAQAVFSCDIDAVQEGTFVFPHEPLVRVEGPLWMCELIEAALLNFVSDQSSTMSRAVRMLDAAGWKPISDNSLRRGGSIGGSLSKALAAYKAGFASTSSLKAHQLFGIPSAGTMGHCFVMSFDLEDETTIIDEQAFEAFAAAFPKNSIFLPDTIETISGIRAAVRVGLRMQARNQKMKAVRLDSGDLAGLSKFARKLFDESGLEFARVNGTNSLNEETIASLNQQGAQIDSYSSGDSIAESGLFGTVYKLAMIEGKDGVMRGRIKLSEQEVKVSLPGRLAARRYFVDGKMFADLIYDSATDDLSGRQYVQHPSNQALEELIPADARYEELLRPLFRNGKRIADIPTIDWVRGHIRQQIDTLPEGCRRLDNPQTYLAGTTQKLVDEKRRLMRDLRRRAKEANEEAAV